MFAAIPEKHGFIDRGRIDRGRIAGLSADHRVEAVGEQGRLRPDRRPCAGPLDSV